MLGGLIDRVRRAARGYLLLEKRGYAVEGRALVRSALEHAVTAQWAFLVPDGVTRLEVGLLRARATYADRSRGIGGADWDGIVGRIESQIPRDEYGRPLLGMPKLTGRDSIISELDQTGYLGRAYRVLSRAGHVTDQAITDYFVEEEDGTLAVASAPSETHDVSVFHTLAASCCLAAWVLARLEGDSRGLELATSQGLLWRLDTHLPREGRRFPDEIA